ncbi:hypothetical protein [Amycolatopsis sp. cmx-4-68]|uniref:hypothetical protein n=1 Tax=Amycolatopsis sp. cmx-4-68 TaxID=2790938 RepID=UPI00397A2974
MADDATLPLPGFGSMVVDQTHHRVFISGGPSANGVVVADFDGSIVKTLNGQYGATGLVLSEDGKVLYAGLADGDAISAIDTGTLTELRRYPTGPQSCPAHLARAGAIVWFGYGCGSTWNGRIGRLDPTSTEPVALDKAKVAFQTAPLLAASGGATSPLVAGQLSLSLTDVHVFTVAGADLVAGPAGEVFGSNLVDLALSPDATTVHSAAGSQSGVEAFSTADLARRGTYATGAHPNSVRPSPDGRYIAVGAYTSRNKAVWVFEAGGTTPVASLGLGGYLLADRGLAWSPDRKWLFAVVQGAADTRPRLLSMSRPVQVS